MIAIGERALKNHHRVVRLVACVIGLVGSAGFAADAEPTSEPSTPSAEPPSDSGALGEIVVTAQRRTESLEKAALTVDVLGADSLTRAGVTEPDQLTSALPGVQIGTSGPATAVYIRGVGGFQSTASSSPAVPYYIDGVYVARTQSVVSELYDVNRVEVVKGPQGTLYGRNASGGAINVLTRDPELGVFGGDASFELGDYRDRNGEFAVNVPVGDTFAVRASGTIVDKGGYTSVGFTGDKHDAGRLKALWKPNDDFSLLLNASYGSINGGSSSIVALPRSIPGWYPWLDSSDPRTQAYVAANAVVPIPGFVRTNEPSDQMQDLSFYNLSAQLNWNLGFADLTVIPAFRDSTMQYTGLFGFLLRNGYDLGSYPNSPLTSKASSLEARLTGDAGPLKYVAGFYADNETQNEQFTVNGGYLQTVGQQTVLGTRSYAGFGQATFAVSNWFRLIGGLRYTADRRQLTGDSYIVSPAAFLGPPPPQAAACALPDPTEPQCLVDSYVGKKTFDNVSFKGGFEADVLNDSLLYATVSRGFKAGGFNDQSAIGSPGSALLFQPEILTSYEAGLKSRLLHNTLQLNGSVFYWDYKNHQEPELTYTNVPGVTALVTYNAGASQIDGATFDAQVRPWSGATIGGSVEYAHSYYKSFLKTIPTFSYDPTATGCPVASQNAANTVLNCSGFEVSRMPEWSSDIDLTQEIDVLGGKLIGNGTMTYASARWIGTDFIADERVPSYAKLDLSLTYEFPGEHWALVGFVRNVTNVAIYTDGARDPFSPLVYADIQPPRTYGARVSFKF